MVTRLTGVLAEKTPTNPETSLPLDEGIDLPPVAPLPRDVPPKLDEVDSAAFSEDLQGEPDPFSPSFRVFCTHCKATFDMMLAFRR